MSDLAQLQRLLDSSWASAGAGARSAWSQTPRMQAREVADFLRQQRYCALCTTGRQAVPHQVPVSFLSLDGGSFWLPTAAGARRLADVRHQPMVALMLGQAVTGGHTLVMVDGPVTVVAAANLPAAVAALAEAKLGDTGWAAFWLHLQPTRVIAYEGGAG